MKPNPILWLALVLSGGLFGCSSFGTKTGTTVEDQPPVTLGHACFDFNQDETNAVPTPPEHRCLLSLIWVEGKHTMQDAEPWCGDGEKYSGKFIFRVKLTNGVTVDTPLESLCPNGCFDFIFAEEAQPWQIKMADYNNDGQPDFNIVNYASCELSDCFLFTITPLGKVELLRFDGKFGEVDAFTMSKESDQSTDQLEGNLTSTGFYYEYNDRFDGPRKLAVESFDWDAKQKIFHELDHVIQLRQ
jgi:hypothetical protein